MRYYAATLSHNPAHQSIIETASFEDAQALVAAQNQRLGFTGSADFATVLSENGRSIMNAGKWPEVRLVEFGPHHCQTYGDPHTRTYDPE